jgi:hypothetical protein
MYQSFLTACLWLQTPLRPKVLMFNWGLHSRFPAGSTPVVPGQHGDPARYAQDLEQIVQKLVVWAAASPAVSLLFAITSPMLNDQTIDNVVVGHNKQAVEVMARHRQAHKQPAVAL